MSELTVTEDATLNEALACAEELDADATSPLNEKVCKFKNKFKVSGLSKQPAPDTVLVRFKEDGRKVSRTVRSLTDALRIYVDKRRPDLKRHDVDGDAEGWEVKSVLNFGLNEQGQWVYTIKWANYLGPPGVLLAEETEHMPEVKERYWKRSKKENGPGSEVEYKRMVSVQQEASEQGEDAPSPQGSGQHEAMTEDNNDHTFGVAAPLGGSNRLAPPDGGCSTLGWSNLAMRDCSTLGWSNLAMRDADAMVYQGEAVAEDQGEAVAEDQGGYWDDWDWSDRRSNWSVGVGATEGHDGSVSGQEEGPGAGMGEGPEETASAAGSGEGSEGPAAGMGEGPEETASAAGSGEGSEGPGAGMGEGPEETASAAGSGEGSEGPAAGMGEGPEETAAGMGEGPEETASAAGSGEGSEGPAAGMGEGPEGPAAGMGEGPEETASAAGSGEVSEGPSAGMGEGSEETAAGMGEGSEGPAAGMGEGPEETASAADVIDLTTDEPAAPMDEDQRRPIDPLEFSRRYSGAPVEQPAFAPMLPPEEPVLAPVPECRVCYQVFDSNMCALQPCGHIVCSTCVPRLERLNYHECPLCRAYFRDHMRVFL